MKKFKILSFLALIIWAGITVSCKKDDPEAEVLTPVITSVIPGYGSAGDIFQINGSNFSETASENEVMFGTVKATVSSASTTRLSIQTPQPFTTGTVSITVKVKTKTSAAFQFTSTASTPGAIIR